MVQPSQVACLFGLHRITGGPEPKAPFLIGLSGSKDNARTATDPPFARVFVPVAGVSERSARH